MGFLEMILPNIPFRRRRASTGNNVSYQIWGDWSTAKAATGFSLSLMGGEEMDQTQ